MIGVDRAIGTGRWTREGCRMEIARGNQLRQRVGMGWQQSGHHGATLGDIDFFALFHPRQNPGGVLI